MRQSPFFKKTKPYGKTIRALDLEVRFSCDPLDYEVTASGVGDRQLFTWWDHGADEEERTVPDEERAWTATKTLPAVDAWALRAGFEGVKTPHDALKFLRLSGPFKPRDGQDGPAAQGSVSWVQFREWQVYFENQRLRMRLFGAIPEQFAAGGVIDSHLRGNPAVRFYASEEKSKIKFVTWITCHSVLEVIAATILVDKLQGIKDARCAWTKCGEIFHRTYPLKETCDRTCARGWWREKNPGDVKAVARTRKSSGKGSQHALLQKG